MKIYIAGQITGYPNYRQQFMAAERRLAELGFSVMNPAWLGVYPEFDYWDYIAISREMMKHCEAIFLLPHWESSQGAKAERQWFEHHKLPVFDSSPGKEAECWRALEDIASKERAEREERLGKGLLDTVCGWLNEALQRVNEPGLKKAEEAVRRAELDALRRCYDEIAGRERHGHE